MGWGFTLRPRSPEGYSTSALQEIEAWIKRWPAYRRSDGCWVLCDDWESRDEIVSEGTVDQIRDVYNHVWPKAHELALEVNRCSEYVPQLAEFIEWCLSRWSADFYDETTRPFTVAQFLKEMSPQL